MTHGQSLIPAGELDGYLDAASCDVSLEGFVLIGVDAPIEVRFDRAQKRARPGDGLTLAEFREKEARENSPDRARQQLSATFAMADYTLDNGGSLEELRRGVDAFLRNAYP